MILLGGKWHETKALPKAKYKIRGLSGIEYMEHQDLVLSNVSLDEIKDAVGGADAEAKVTSATARKLDNVNKYAVEHGVLDWDDVFDEQDNPVKFDKKRLMEIPYLHICELASEIAALSVLTEDQEKN